MRIEELAENLFHPNETALKSWLISRFNNTLIEAIYTSIFFVLPENAVIDNLSVDVEANGGIDIQYKIYF